MTMSLFRFPQSRVSIAFVPGLMALLATGGATHLVAQTTPAVYYACYVPLTGTVYRIKEGNLKTTCTTGHVEFSWTDGANAVRTTDPLAGDLSGVFSNATVVKLLGRALSTTPPQAGEVLMWNGTSWTPAPAPSGGNTALGGDVAGPSNAATVVGLRGHPISTNTPQFGNFLRFDGSGWNGAATVDHSELGRLSSDDHPQYLLGNGVRNSTDGFAVTGTLGSGQLLASGAGARLLWYPAKAAFRAGLVTADAWDDSNIGPQSIALGRNPTASGFASIALGEGAIASGQAAAAIGFGATGSGLNAIALGQSALASFQSAAALGFRAIASGLNATAIGHHSEASGQESIAIGNASTNGQTGAVAIADRSSVGTLNRVSASTPNQFVVRAQHFWLGTNNSVSNPAGHFLTTSTGAFLSSGGAWTNASDVALKNAFRDVDADDVLTKIARLPIRSWSYKAENPSVRHVGPTAQDFRAAFGLGNAETSIATVDTDGISLLGIQALEKRTRELERENKELRARLERLEAALKQLPH
jgi:hypothetical protein